MSSRILPSTFSHSYLPNLPPSDLPTNLPYSSNLPTNLPFSSNLSTP